jgi:rhodanese-related sulfurtransferase
MSAQNPLEITPAGLQSSLETVVLLDVREPFEHAIARLDGARVIPMGSVPSALPEIERLSEDALIVVYCHHGIRSLNVVHWLRGRGVDNCVSLAGGIDRWSREIDASVPRY